MSKEKLSKKKTRIAAIEQERTKLIKVLLEECELIEGSYRESLMRCGRKECHCYEKPGHLVARISRWEEGKLKNKVVRLADREWVKKLADNYKNHKKAMSQLLKLNTKEGELLRSVIKLKKKRYE